MNFQHYPERLHHLKENLRESPLQPKQLNSEIIHSIKKAKQKLSVDLGPKHKSKQQSQEQFDQYCSTYRGSLKPKDNFIDKTMNSLKTRIAELQKQKEKIEEREKRTKDNSKIQIQNMKAQLAKFVEKQFELTMRQDINPHQIKLQIQDLKQKLKRGDIQTGLLKQKLRNAEQKNGKLEKSIKSLQNQYEYLQKEKQKHIELNISEKMQLEQQIKAIKGQVQKKGSIIKKLQQQNINLKRQIHGIFNKERLNKHSESIQKKSKQEYEFEIKQISQKFTIKLKNQQKELNMLRKNLQKFKQQTNQSQSNKMIQYEQQIQQKRQKLIQKQKKLAAKNIQIEKLNSNVQILNKALQQKEYQIKTLQQIINKKNINQQELTHKLAKSGITPRDTSKSLKKSSQIQQNQEKKRQITFQNSFQQVDQSKIQVKTSEKKQQQRISRSQSKQKSNINEIVTQERALAGLRSNYKKVDSKEMSLNEIMLEIRRKTDKINDLRSKKIKDMV